jgi:hypothetical protein
MFLQNCSPSLMHGKGMDWQQKSDDSGQCRQGCTTITTCEYSLLSPSRLFPMHFAGAYVSPLGQFGHRQQ